MHSEVYYEVHNYLKQIKHLRAFINRRFGTTQPPKIITFVLVVNKATQIGISKKMQPHEMDLIK